MKNKLKKIEKYGKKYIDEYLYSYVKDTLGGDIKKLTKNSYLALLFFFDKAFYRGRKDEISTIFKNRTVEVLQEYKNISKIISSSKEIKTQLKTNNVNNPKDIDMVISTINKISNISENNIVKYAINRIKEKNIQEVVKYLTDINQIGPKLSGLFLRDLVFLFKLKKYIKKQEIYFQPIDTWVEQVAKQIKLVTVDEKNKEIIAQEINKKCLENGVSPLLFNAGAWYIGANSFKVLLQLI